MTATDRDPDTAGVDEHAGARAKRHPTDLAFVAAAGGISAIVAADGALGWRVARVLVTIAVVELAQRLHRAHRFGGVVTSVVGVVAIAIGLAFGPRYAAFGSWGLTACAGWLALASGLVLTVTGLARVAGGGGRWRAVPVALIAVMAGLLLLRVIAPAVMAANVPPVTEGHPTPIEAGLQATAVTFESADGVPLAGWYVPSTNGAAVVLRHGAGRSTSASVVDHAAVLAEHGYGVLITDARGHGASGGRAMDFGWYGERDIAGAVTFLERRPDVDPGRIGVVGMSMGGEEAIGAIGDDPRIAAVVAEGATVRTAADTAWMPDVYGWRGSVQGWLDAVQFGITDLLTDAPRPDSLAAAAAAASPRPILLIAASEVADEPDAANHIAARAGGNVSVWVVAGSGHTYGLEVAPAEWERHVIAFLDDALA
jgi:dienelactone hydrolase